MERPWPLLVPQTPCTPEIQGSEFTGTVSQHGHADHTPAFDSSLVALAPGGALAWTHACHARFSFRFLISPRLGHCQGRGRQTPAHRGRRRAGGLRSTLPRASA
ncbi:hypothetical protein MRX96_014213 [Rhipicephalus microplus]